MNRRLIGDQQHSGEKVCFSLNSAVASALTALSERRRALMAKKAVPQLVADIAALAVGVMRVIVDDCRPPTAGHRHRREGGATGPEKGRGVAVELTKHEKHNVEVGAHLGGVDRVERPRPICSRTRREMRLASALKPRRKANSAAPKLFVGADHNVLHQLGILRGEVRVRAQERGELGDRRRLFLASAPNEHLGF